MPIFYRFEVYNPGKREISRDSVQYPLEGCKYLGGGYKLLISYLSQDFLFFITVFME